MASQQDDPQSADGVILKDRRSWPAWFIQLEFQSNFRGIWHLVDPELPDAPHISNDPPSAPPTFAQMMAEQDEKNQQEHIARVKQWESSCQLEANI